MDLAALIKDGQVAWLHSADIPPDLRPSEPAKPGPAPKALSAYSKFPAAPDPAGELPHIWPTNPGSHSMVNAEGWSMDHHLQAVS